MKSNVDRIDEDAQAREEERVRREREVIAEIAGLPSEAAQEEQIEKKGKERE